MRFMHMPQNVILGPHLLRCKSVREYFCLERSDTTLGALRDQLQAGKEENCVNNPAFIRQNLWGF
jgi:hypothetical protein